MHSLSSDQYHFFMKCLFIRNVFALSLPTFYPFFSEVRLIPLTDIAFYRDRICSASYKFQNKSRLCCLLRRDKAKTLPF